MDTREPHIRAKLYMDEVIRFSKRLLGSNLVSIVLFGSFARNEGSKISDVDLLIVVHKKNKRTKLLYRIIRALEIKYGFTFVPKGFFGKLLYSVSNVTGIFRPAFIAELRDLKNWRFSRIFSTSWFMTKIFAPTEAVKFTITNSYRIIYGDDPFKGTKVKRFSIWQLIRSLFMNLILAVASFVLIPLYKETYKFTYEAMKWSMFAYAYATNRRPKINELSKLFREPLKKGIEHFIMTRTNGKLSPGLLVYAIPSIVKIHIMGIRNIRNSKLRIKGYGDINSTDYKI